jgi:ABC-2 type transport system ATP-binding protein
VHIQTSDSDATLYAVLDAGYRPSEIEVGSLGLEQAFLAITAEDDRANGADQADGADQANVTEPAPARWLSAHHTD